MLSKIVAVQSRVGQKLTMSEKIHIFRQRPDFVCLPEYLLGDTTETDYRREAIRAPDHLSYLLRLSDELATCLIAGSVVESEGGRLYNTSYVFDRGNFVGKYRKRHPVQGELSAGICAGEDTLVFDYDGIRVGLMICGDVFYPEMYDAMQAEAVDIIFVPTTSLFRPADSLSWKKHRDENYFLNGARRSGAFIVKVCGIGQLFGRPLQGRSMIAAPWGIISQVESTAESRVRLLSLTLSITELREFGRRLTQAPQGEPRESFSRTGANQT